MPGEFSANASFPAGGSFPATISFPVTITFPNVLPVNLAVPTITPSTASVGNTLTSHQGNWTGPGLAFTYQWKRGGVNIGGATSATYLLVSDDGGTNVTVTETATNIYGNASATSAAVAVSAGFDPATITNLALFLQYDAAHCTSSTPGQPVSAVSASYGTSRTASQTLLLRPTFRANGLEYGPTQYMDLSSSLELAGAFTAYHVFSATSDDCLNVGSVAGGAFFGFAGSQYTAQDDGFAPTSVGTGSSGILLARISGDGAGNVSISITGGNTASNAGIGTFTFDCIGAAPGGGPYFSGSTANRNLCDIIKTSDNTGTAENTNILAWILAAYGATLS